MNSKRGNQGIIKKVMNDMVGAFFQNEGITVNSMLDTEISPVTELADECAGDTLGSNLNGITVIIYDWREWALWWVVIAQSI